MEIVVREADPAEFEVIGEVLLSRSTMLALHAIYDRLGFARAPELDETWDDVTLLGFALRLS